MTNAVTLGSTDNSIEAAKFSPLTLLAQGLCLEKCKRIGRGGTEDKKKIKNENELEPVSTRDNRVFNWPLGRSLHLFARTAHSAHSLCSAPLCYARFARSLHSRARSLTSLTPLWDS